MAKKEKIKGLDFSKNMKDVLVEFDLKALKRWMKKYRIDLYNVLIKADEKLQMATMCRMIINRNDMLATEASQNLKGKFAMSDPYFFRSALESTMRMCGMSTSMLRDHDKSDQYLFGFSNYLFDYDGMEM